MGIKAKDFRVREGRTIHLQKWPASSDPICLSNDAYWDLLQFHVAGPSALQQMLYAANRYTLLLILQAVDAAGNDGAIKLVMSSVYPQGCQVFGFKRSYCEEALLARVHPEILRGEGLPNPPKHEKTAWAKRYRSILDLERHLTTNGTRIVKIFLHLSKDEQRKRFLGRIDDPEKNWKFSQADVDQRKFWPDYMEAYEDYLMSTSTDDPPWYVVPADDKQNARLVVSRNLLDTLGDMNLADPETTDTRRQERLAICRGLVG